MSETTQQRDAWTPERIAMVKQGCCPEKIPEHEANLFIEQCKRSGLDPLLKEAFCVARRANVGNRERPVWVTKYEFQPSETGMLARAERFPDFKGIQASAVFGEDEFVMDQGEGKVVHRFNPAKRKGSLTGAWARVVREGKLPVLVWLEFAGYVQTTPLWAKIPTTMIEKCARVSALRKAYPEAFGGLYVREEMPAEEFQAPPDDAPPSPAPARPREGPPPRETPAPDARPQAPDAAGSHAPASAGNEPVKPNSPVVVAFGPHKGKTATDLSDDALSETIDLAHEKLIEQPRARWARAMRENLTALEHEAEVRCRPPPPSPGLQIETPPAPAAATQGATHTGRKPRTPPADVVPFPAKPAPREPGDDSDDEAPNPFGDSDRGDSREDKNPFMPKT